MKKIVLTLSALALAVNAQAYTLLENQETGTKIDFTGSARLVWQSSASKDTDTSGFSERQHINRAVRNNGSRFGLAVKQDLAAGVYALGRIEWRARGTASSQHDFDDWYTRQLYAGFGHKEYGELTYGNQTVITDSVKQTDLANTLSLSDGLLVSAARRSLQYTYSGIKGLKVGAYYGAESPRGNDGLDLANKRKDVVGVGATYQHQLDEKQSISSGVGMSHERNKNANGSTYDRNAYALGVAYTFDKTTVGIDLERRVTEDQGTVGNKRTQNEVRTIVHQQLTDDWNAYAMYAHKTNKLDAVAAADTKAKANQFMIGTEYYLAKQALAQYQLKAKAFVEWQTTYTQNYESGVKAGKSRNNETVVGFRFYW